MNVPVDPTNEPARLNALQRSRLLQTPRDPAFDRITQLAATLFEAPIALVTLLWGEEVSFKSSVGTRLEGVTLENSFSIHVIASDDVTVVPDTTLDARFADNPLVTGESHIRFYAAAPLFNTNGYKLGTLSVLDRKPRHDFGERDQHTLRELAGLVSSCIKMRESAGHFDAATGIYTYHRMLDGLAHVMRQPLDVPREHIRLVGVLDVAMPRQMHDLTQVMGYQQTEHFILECIDRLSSAVGATRDLFRIGLFRFGFVLVERPGPHVQRKLSTLVNSLRAPFDSGVGILLAPSATLGVTMLTADAESPEEILRQASTAADDAWESPRFWSFYKPKSDALRQRKFQLLTNLPDAIAGTDQLYLEYQPKIDLSNRRCVGVEALLRWQHPELGAISPIELIEAAEKTALMCPLTDWVLDAALAQYARWHEAGLDLPIAVNLSAHDLADENMIARVTERLARANLPGECLVLEFTESTLIRDLDAVIPKLRQLHVMGVATAIDDFGTGYCNLSYLQKLNASTIKIDRRFVQALDDDPRGQTLTRAIVQLAHDLDYQIVAEGVESESMLERLIEWGCEQAQGYLFSRPLPADSLYDWALENGARMIEPTPLQRGGQG